MVNSNGEFAINKTSPSSGYDLDVNGDINYTGEIYQDGVFKVFGTKLSNTETGYIPFGDNDEVLTSNSVFFWDNINNRLGVN